MIEIAILAGYTAGLLFLVYLAGRLPAGNFLDEFSGTLIVWPLTLVLAAWAWIVVRVYDLGVSRRGKAR